MLGLKYLSICKANKKNLTSLQKTQNLRAILSGVRANILLHLRKDKNNLQVTV